MVEILDSAIKMGQQLFLTSQLGGLGITGAKLVVEKKIAWQMLKPNSLTCNCASSRPCHHVHFGTEPRSVGTD